MKIMTNLYKNGSKLGLRIFFNKWKNNYLDYIKRLNDAGKGVNLLRKGATKPVLRQFHKAIIHNGKYDKIKKMLINSLRNNDKNNLAYCFNLWRDKAQKLKELQLKCKFLRLVANNQDKKSEDYWKNRLHEVLLKWRINCAPNNSFDYLKNARIGLDQLEKGLRKPHNRKL